MRNQYIRVEQNMIVDLNLTGVELVTYAYIKAYTSDSKECYATLETIGRYFNITRQSVHRAIVRLLDKELIAREETDERISYRTLDNSNSDSLFHIYNWMGKRVKNINELLVFAFLRNNLKAIEKDIANALRLSRNTVSKIFKNLEVAGVIVKEKIRNARGRIKGIVARLNNYKKCDTESQLSDTESKKCYTDTKRDNKKYIKTGNKFNRIIESDSYADKTESELEAMLDIF